MVIGNTERLSDVVKLSAHVTRVLGQNPGMMTLQGTNSYLLQPPSNPHAPLILIDTSSPHTSRQYVDLLMLHLHHLGLESGVRETHFESEHAERSLRHLPEDKVDEVKSSMVKQRQEDPRADELGLVEYGPGSRWATPPLLSPKRSQAVAVNDSRKIPHIEHIILTHRHLDHVGALSTLLLELKKNGCPPPKLWKFPSPDEADLVASERERPTCDAELWKSLPPPQEGAFHPFSPLQPFHPIIPGLMISIIDPNYKHLLRYGKDGKAKWNEVPEIARVSVRCLRTPGHTNDSVSLVMMEGEKGVFTGDTVLGQGTTQFEDLQSYMTSLRTLLTLKPNVLYPAHGPHIPTARQAREHIEMYISHRQEREDQIVAILKRFSSSASMSEDMQYGSDDDGDDGDAVDEKDEKDSVIPPEGDSTIDEDDEKVKTKIVSSPLGRALIRLKKDIHRREEMENETRGPLMIDRHRPRPMPDFQDEKKALSTAMVIMSLDDSERVKEEVVPMSMICRLLYKSEEERLLFAASKGIKSHLVKLENEGKVRKDKVKWCKLVGNQVGGVEEMDGWRWIGDDIAKAERKEDKHRDELLPA
ncbi:hypothetical protein IAR55_003401 [Kwoniella newhampshirensis]|uniref:Metallo-beta-lactamase domain-containing protein n=1 Tax=Kwoniella newhampshirensis TaxID=1651941 RepID=A0AAW0YYK5_9TREE